MRTYIHVNEMEYYRKRSNEWPLYVETTVNINDSLNHCFLGRNPNKGREWLKIGRAETIQTWVVYTHPSFFSLVKFFNLFQHRLNYCIVNISPGCFNFCVVKDSVVHKFTRIGHTVLFWSKVVLLCFAGSDR